MRCNMHTAMHKPSRTVKRPGAARAGVSGYFAALGAALPTPAASRAACRLPSCSSSSL